MNTNTKASQELHKRNPKYGSISSYLDKDNFKYYLTIPDAIKNASIHTEISSLLDYGTGKGGLIKAVEQAKLPPMSITGYDPGVEKFSKIPTTPHDLVTSVDVLEHMDQTSIGFILQNISQLTAKFFFFCIDLVPASKKLSDKRNAHTLIAPPDWWSQQIKNHFLITTFIETGHLPDGSKYPKQLFGCATNSMLYFRAMNTFLENVKVANHKIIWKSDGTTCMIPYKP